MTLKEAIKILKKEGFHMILEKKVIYQNGAIREFEKPEVCEAIKVANENRLTVGLTPIEWNERETRLNKEHEENTKDPDSVENHIKEDSGVNPALSESASQFNDALLNEQAKKIEELTKDKELMKKATLSQLDDFIEIYNLLTKESQKAKRLGKEITRLNKAIHKKNMKIEELRKESSRHLRGKIKVFYENVDLEKMLKDKDAVLSDVAEELRLSKIREKNLTEVCQKYMKENEELKKKLANKIVDKIDAQALKSAESALAYKDEVIETLDKELAEAKHELSSLKRQFRPESTEAVVLFANAYAKAERKHLPCTEWKNDGKEVSATYILENGKKSKIALDFTGDEIIFSRTDPDKPRKDSLYSYKDKQLAEKDEVIDKITKENNDYKKVVEEFRNKIADMTIGKIEIQNIRLKEKDEVIADLGNELAATKKELEEKTHLVEIIRNASNDYRDYGVAANEFIKKLANLYVTAGSKGTISNKMFERCKNYQTYGFPANCDRETKKEIDGIARGNQNMKK